jgi:hypothetical protein
MDGKEKELPEKKWIETPAGLVRICDSTPKSFSEVSRFYDVHLKPSASSEEIKIGRFTVQLQKVGDLKNTSIYTAISKELGDDKTIAEIFRFQPLGAPSMRKLSAEAKQYVNQGIGTESLRLAMEDLKSAGVDGVCVRASLGPISNLIEEKFGFQKIGEDVYFKSFSVSNYLK